MRVHNAAIVVRRLWDEPEGLSRADLSRELGLSRSTVSAIVSGLVGSGLVVESHRARSTGGRRAIVLRFFEDHRHVLGLDVGASHLTLVRTDLRGRVIARAKADHDVQDDPAGTLALISDLARRVLDPAGPPLLALGVGVPCPVDARSAHQLSPRILPAWRDIPLGTWLHQTFDLPVYMDNDANMGALAEGWWGAGRDHAHFAYIKLGTGVGSGYLIDHGTYRGSSGIAGEIGHTTVHAEGRPCRCGLRGCLEAEVGSASLLAKVQDALHQGRPSSLSAVASPTLTDLIEHARAEDPLAREIIDEAGVHLGIAIANLLNLLNPGRVVLGGKLVLAGDLLLDPLRSTVQDRALSTSLERADITLGELAQDQVAVGAATLVIQHALQQPQLFHPRPNGVSAPAHAIL